MDDVLVLEGKYFFEQNFPIHLAMCTEASYNARHCHDFIELSYVCNGKGIHHIGLEQYDVSEGDLYIIPPGITHVFHPVDLTGRSPLVVLNCLYDPSLFSLSSGLSPPNGANWSFHREKGSTYGEILHRMLYLQHKHECFRHQIIELLSVLISALRNSGLQQPVLTELIRINVSPIYSALEFMGSRYQNALSLEDICRRACMSVRHFQRMFKQMTGRSCIQMLQDIRIQYACVLLKHTTWSVQTIAECMGIHDMKYFYRLFHDRLEQTPALYRKSSIQPIHSSSYHAPL
ncbi:AraC family transcriptional regulator [Paenibacillus hubeiensis]|uniref:AraC family transcriptional regulator n=1 Tax=Paenibacillus hubeiensis TaxID=3077330 RepID=UPI0031BBB001